MTFLSSIYGGVVGARNALYDRGTLPARRLQAPVISVGNLSVGGAGKTPFVITLGALLAARGLSFDVLTRGYGRGSRGALVVDPAGDASQFGDEPLLIAQKLGVPVVVGEDRYAAGMLAEQKFASQYHLLDDGFQHRSLARDFDIVLVTPEDARDRLLPGGRLREPPSALRRADAVVLMSGAKAEDFPLQGKLVWRARRGLAATALPPQAVAFCGIARPQNFFRQLRLAGCEPVAEAGFRDHHAYTAADVRDLLALRERSGAASFVTTEKDAINLGTRLIALAPVVVVPVKMDLLDAGAAMDAMLGAIRAKRGTRP